MENLKKHIVTASELLKMKVPPPPLLDKTKEQRYCHICRRNVNMGWKHYHYPNPANNLPSRKVCGGGCNTDWDDLKRI